MNEAPHAPWWHYNAQDNPQLSGLALLNPSAEVIGYLYEYGGQRSESFLTELTEAVLAYLGSLKADAPIADGIYCCLRLLQAKNLPTRYKNRLLDILLPLGEQLVTRDPAQWSSYCIKPLWLVPSPDSPLAQRLEPEIQKNLDYEIEHQQADGSWAPFWSWGSFYPEIWPEAEREWRGVLTLKTLKSLRDYGRLENG
jgi:hypothetical protein